MTCQPSFMVDWLTVDLPDPVCVPVNSGQVLSVTNDGVVEWSTAKRLQLRGSWDSSMTFRALAVESSATSVSNYRRYQAMDIEETEIERRRSPLQISGNPAKFLNGHNLFGSADVSGLLSGVIDKAQHAIWPHLDVVPAVDVSAGEISRIDLTASWLLDRAEDVLPVLRAIEETVWCPYRGRGVFDAGGSTLYFGRTAKGKRAKDWALKLYWKGAEVGVHKLPKPAYCVPGLLEELQRTIRVELTLRTPELKRLDLRSVGQWTPAIVAQIWEAYMGKLDFGQSTVNLDAVDLRKLGLNSRLTMALAAWKAGNDLRAAMSRPTFYRLRKKLIEKTGFDIATKRSSSNVVPLRRLVTVTPALYPRWADQLTEALEVAA